MNISALQEKPDMLRNWGLIHSVPLVQLLEFRDRDGIDFLLRAKHIAEWKRIIELQLMRRVSYPPDARRNSIRTRKHELQFRSVWCIGDLSLTKADLFRTVVLLSDMLSQHFRKEKVWISIPVGANSVTRRLSIHGNESISHRFIWTKLKELSTLWLHFDYWYRKTKKRCVF